MADVIHEHEAGGSGAGMGFAFGILMIILFMYLLFAYGIPLMRNSDTEPSVTIPDQVDVNINGGSQGGTQ